MTIYIFLKKNKLTAVAENRFDISFGKITMFSWEKLDRCNKSGTWIFAEYFALEKWINSQYFSGSIYKCLYVFLLLLEEDKTLWKNTKLFDCVGENTETTLTLRPSLQKKSPFSSITNIKQASDVSPYPTDSCYLGAPLGCLSEFGTCEHLYGNPKNLVQNPHVQF